MASPALPDPADSTARLLALVLERAPRTPGDLRAALGLVEPEFAPLLAALERHGLVARDAASGRVAPRAPPRCASRAPRSRAPT